MTFSFRPTPLIHSTIRTDLHMNHYSDYAPSIMSLVEAVNRHLKENGFLVKEALFETTEIVILEV